MAKKEIKIERPKVRRTWKVKPFTKVEPSKKVYKREREKESLKDVVAEETRVLGVDLGERRVGLAISDPLRTIAVPLETVDREIILVRLGELIKRRNVVKIVVGLPVNMNGSRGEMAEAAEKFAAQIEEKFQLPVILWDERLTSVSAERAMREAGEKPSRAKETVDRISAALILEGYLKSRM